MLHRRMASGLGPVPFAAFVAALAALPCSAAKAASGLPRFKWGQTKDLIILSIMVRDLDPASVSVALPNEGELSFSAKSAKGEESSLSLSLREDVKLASLKWEIAPRPDKFGTATVITMSKVNAHRWDLLVTDPKKYKGVMDKDWTREEQTLEPEEEVPYVEDHPYLLDLTARNFNRTLSKYRAVVANVRYPWCSECKSQDATFAKAAKQASKAARSGKSPEWKKMSFAVVDAREQRALARQLGARCDFNCEYRIFTGLGEEPTYLKAKWSEDELLKELSKFLSPAVEVPKSAEDLVALKEKNSTCHGDFSGETSTEYTLFRRAANVMRGELVFAATFGGGGTITLWPHKQNSSFAYEGTLEDNGTALVDWLKPRSIPLLQEFDWQKRETYEKIGLPVAKVWINDEDKNPSFNNIVRYAVRRLAKSFIGRMAFVEQKKSSYSYELRDFGLNQPEVYPAFGVSSNVSYNAIKYGFEITEDLAPSVHDFWMKSDEAHERLADFCEKVLAGTWPEAHESGPPQVNWTVGQAKKVVWKTFSRDVLDPERPLLLEVFSKYRTENEKRSKEAENLAEALKPHAEAFTLASYDTSDNHVPKEVLKREKYSSDTEWFWVPKKAANAERPAVKKLMKPKKDAPVKTVLEFAKKQSGLDLPLDEVYTRFEELMKLNPPPAPPPPFGSDDVPEEEDDDDEAEVEAAAAGSESSESKKDEL